MGNREIEFDAEGRPRAAVRYVGFLDGRIFIKHRLAADFVDASVDVASQIGQHGALQVFIFQKDGAPGVIGAAIR